MGTTNTRTQLSEPPINDRMLLRLSRSLTATSPSPDTCRIAHGVETAFAQKTISGTLPPGGPGVYLSAQAAEIDAVAVYKFQPGVACPTPILR